MRGFTLIETIVYLALLSFILSGTMVAVYAMLENGGSIAEKTTTEDEGFFTTRKLEWIMSDMTSITSPSSGIGSALSITRSDGTVIEVRLEDGVIEMFEDSGTPIPLTTGNVEVTYLGFERHAGTPPGVTASTTINDIVFSATNYLRN